MLNFTGLSVCLCVSSMKFAIEYLMSRDIKVFTVFVYFLTKGSCQGRKPLQSQMFYR